MPLPASSSPTTTTSEPCTWRQETMRRGEIPSALASLSRLLIAVAMLGGSWGVPRLELRFQSAPSGAHLVEIPCTRSGYEASAWSRSSPPTLYSPSGAGAALPLSETAGKVIVLSWLEWVGGRRRQRLYGRCQLL